MPIYEYECDDCGHQFEALQKMSDDLLIDCPQCDQPTLRKLVSAAAFRLKGKGWYETDFKGDGKKNLSSSDSTKSVDKKSDEKAAKANKKSADSGKTTAANTTAKPGGGSKNK